jgi:hypothetical protein
VIESIPLSGWVGGDAKCMIRREFPKADT